MLDSLIRNSLRYRFLIVVVSLVLLVYGSYLTTKIPIDVFPDLDRPRVILLTECPGMATEEVETLVTQPIEVALLGANGVEAVRSQSTAGLNVVYIEFDWDVEIRAARQTVQERLLTLTNILPEGIVPQMTPPSSIMGQIIVAGVYFQNGPSGGQLVPVGKTNYMAERIETKGAAPVVKVWLPTKRHSPSEWTPVEARTALPGSDLESDSANTPRAQSIEPARRSSDSNQNESNRRDFEITVDQVTHSVSFPKRAQRLLELGTLGDWVVRPRLLKVPGVAEAFLQGGDHKQYQILVRPQALLEYGVTLSDVERAVGESNINTSGGFAIQGESERPIRVLGRVGPNGPQVISDLAKVPVKVTDTRAVLLEDVAQIVEGAATKRGDGAVNGQPGLVFTIVKQPHVDTRKLTDDVTQALEEVESTLPANLVVNSELFRLRTFIDRGVFNVGEALVIGGVLVVAVLFLFLWNFRTTFITLVAIPLSLVITTFVFRLIGFLFDSDLTINVMTLGGIAVAMGELVDDAIVDVENIFRRLKENEAASNPKRPLRVVYEASLEIRAPIVFGTVVVVLVFLPLFAIPGVAGRLFEPLGVAYVVSILSSLLVSLTVTPVLSYYLLPNSPAVKHTSDAWFLRMLKWIASYLIRFSMAIPGPLLLVTWVAVAVAGWQFARLGSSFLPEFDEGSVQVNVTLPAGSSLSASNQIAQLIDERFRSLQKSPANPDGQIVNFVRRTGRAAMDEHAMPVNATEYILTMNPDVQIRRAEIVKKLLEEIKEDVPGIDVEVEQPLAHAISHMVSGVYAHIAIKIYGDDLDKLQTFANQAKASIRQVSGVTDPIVESIRQTDELHVRLRSQDLAFHGLTRAYVAGMLQTALQGRVVSQVLEGQRRFDLLIRLEETYRTDYANLGRLRIDLPEGRGQIELSDIADVGIGSGPNTINRENARRRIVIRCNTQGRDLSSAVAEIRSRLDDSLKLPEGYFLEYSGQFESQQKATRTILVLSVVSFFGMFVVLMALLPSIRIVLQILNALPTAFIGGVLALVITEQTVTVASLVGFISLGGIAIRNGILLVTHYLHLMKEDGLPFSKETILRGSLERLSPVLMTALTAGIALVPLVIGGEAPGREILYPVATVILGGVFTSTFCEFLIHPGLFWQFSGKDASRICQSNEDEEI